MMNRIAGKKPNRGMTLLEVTTVSGLMAFLGIMLSTTWIGVGRPTVDVIVRGELFQEMDAAVAALSRDLGGALGGPVGRLGGKTTDRWVGWMKPADGQLWLCFDGDEEPYGEPDWGPPDTVIVLPDRLRLAGPLEQERRYDVYRRKQFNRIRRSAKWAKI